MRHPMPAHDMPYVPCVDCCPDGQQGKDGWRYLVRHTHEITDSAKATGKLFLHDLPPYYFLALMDEVADHPDGVESIPEVIILSLIHI